MSSDNRLTPYGLTTLDIATSNVLRRFEFDDYEGALVRIRILACVTANVDIIKMVKAELKKISNYKAQFGARNDGITQAENLVSYPKLQGFIAEKAVDLFEKIMLEMKDKKLISQSIEARYKDEGKLTYQTSVKEDATAP